MIFIAQENWRENFTAKMGIDEKLICKTFFAKGFDLEWFKNQVTKFCLPN